MILRLKFEKMGDIAYVSHRDLINVMSRSIRRAGILVKYSEGFNPHAKTSFSPALSLGVESRAEYMDMEVEDDSISCEEVLQRLNNSVPRGLRFLSVIRIERSDSLSAIITHSEYKILIDKQAVEEQILSKAVELIRDEEALFIQKRNKRKEFKEVDVRDMIIKSEYLPLEHDYLISVVLQNSSQGGLKPDDFMEIISRYSNTKIEDYRCLKTRSFSNHSGAMVALD